MDDLPLDLLRVIYRALSKEPETRYQNCREMVDDLKEVRVHLEPPPQAPISSSSRPISRPSSRPVSKPSTLTASDLRKQIEQASRPVWGVPAAPTSKWARWAIGAGVVAVVLAVLSFLPPVRDRLSELFGSHEEHIAVLPFENVGNDPANAAISDGLMDSLSGKLTNLESDKQSLWVVPASEVRRRKITDAASALRDLGATLVVEGTLRRDGQTIHMTVNLVKTKNLRQIGSVPLADQDFSTLEDEAVARIAKLLRIEANPETLRASGSAPNAGAYELYLKALGLTQRYDKAGNLDQAIAALNDAVKADPRFALGYAQLGEAYRLKYQMDKNTKWIDEALANCDKAVELDNKLPSVYVTLGAIHHGAGKYDLSLQEFQRALQLDPRNADAQRRLGGSYDSAGRTADAEAAYKKAIALRPDYWVGYNEFGNFLDGHQRYDEAVAQFKRAIELTPDNASLYQNLAAVYLDSADPKYFPEAEQALVKSLSLEPSYGAYANLGYLYIQERKYKNAADTAEKALQLNDKDYLVWGNLGVAYEGLKDTDNASRAWDRELPLLEQAALASPRDPIVQAQLGLTYAKKKLREKAISRIQSATVLAPDDPNVLEDVGEAYEVLGDRKQAIEYIQKSLQKGNSLTYLKNMPDLQDLLADPAFRTNGK